MGPEARDGQGHSSHSKYVFIRGSSRIAVFLGVSTSLQLITLVVAVHKLLIKSRIISKFNMLYFEKVDYFTCVHEYVVANLK